MWGPAIYFAVNASYSHSYSYKNVDIGNMRQMFLSEVLLGDFKDCASGKYAKPPLKEPSQVEYDSIRGHTQGSDVYMVYSNNKAYTRYLITYKLSSH